MKKCVNCGKRYDEGRFCQECGRELVEEKPLCPTCHKPLPSATAKFCPNCGTCTDGAVHAEGHLGDHNVIAGDVSNVVHNITNTTQNIINQNDAQSTLSCAICGKIIAKGSEHLYQCGVCQNTVCASCYDTEKKECKKCAKKEDENAYSARFEAFDVIKKGNGKYEIKKLIDRDAYTIDIPEGVESIADGAFEDSSIVKVTLPEGVISIGTAAFKNCTMLRTINIPESVMFIDDEAFYGCRRLELDIPSSVDIGSDALNGVKNHRIIKVYVNKTIEQMNDKVSGLDTTTKSCLMDQLADLRVQFAMKMHEDDIDGFGLFVIMFVKAKSPIVDYYSNILKALYRYHYNNPNSKVEYIYNRTLNMAAGYLSVSDNIGLFQSMAEDDDQVEPLDFFDALIQELEFQVSGISPFKNIESKDFLDMFVKHAEKDPYFYDDPAKMQKIRNYIEQVELLLAKI